MGTISTPSGSLGPEGKKKTGSGVFTIILVAVFAALILMAGRGYLKSQEKPPAPVVQPTAAIVYVQPTAAPAPTPVPTVDTERDLRVAEAFLLKHLKSPSTYRRISSAEVWRKTSGHRFRIEYDAQNSYGALMRECSYVPFQEGDPEAPGMTPCAPGDSLGWWKP